MPKPRVLRIINRLNLGGPTYNAAYLTKYMEPEYETLLVAGMKDESEASSEFIVNKLGLDPVYVPDMYRSLHPVKDAKTFRSLRKIIKEFKPDIVHTHAAKAGAVGRMAAYAAGVPVILHTFHGHIFHSYFSTIKTRVFLEIERFLAKQSTKIIAISNLQKQELSNDFKIAPADKFEVIPLGFDLHRFQENTTQKRKSFRDKYDVGEHEIAIGIIGRLVPIKNHRFFIDAIHKLLGEIEHPVRIFIIGDGEERVHIEEYCHELGLRFSTEHDKHHAKPITFTSWIREIDIATAGLDIIALTSLNEGTPVSLIEASASGKPIVSTNVGGIQDVVINDVNAYITEKTDVEGFAHKLKILVEHPELRTSMGLEGIDHAFGNFSYTRLVENMTTLYDKLLKEKKG
ncbi:MAG: glycosyltransferase family 4 protein [Bacteroidetes bacterium]|nr:glycosyltransferase family 4 protein [Bacteroidota bacterium]